jgi:hypothetical protein
MANIARCILDSADNTNLSRFLAEAPWREDAVKRRRESLVVLDDTRCAHVGSLFDHVDATTTTATAPTPWPITRSRACMSVAQSASPWDCVCIAAMKN